MSKQMKADLPNYVTIVQLQKTTDGGWCYVAFHPELPQVMSQGNTAAEAEENLVEATELAIEHLASNRLPVPEPAYLGNVSFRVNTEPSAPVQQYGEMVRL